MKIILIIPATNTERSLSRMRKSLICAPLGVAYIASVLEKNGHKVSIIDQFATRKVIKDVLNVTENEKPDIVGISCLPASINVVKEIVKGIRILNKKIKILLGNTFPSIFYEIFLKEKIADFVIHGEGERKVLDLIFAIEKDKDFSSIPGISYRKNNKIIKNNLEEIFFDLDLLPYPAWHLFDIKKYLATPMVSLKGLLLPVSTFRGCPYKCYFCSHIYTFSKIRIRNVSKVVDEIEYLYNKFGVNNFVVADAFFPINKEYGIKFCEEIINRGINKKMSWFTETRVDKVDLELLKKMEEAGLKMLMFGFDSGNQEILDSVGKMQTLDDSKRAMKYMKKVGITSYGFFILGLPKETRKTCEETINFAIELDCDFAKFNRAIPLPGSKFFEEYRNYHDVLKDSDKYSLWHGAKYGDKLPYVPEGMTENEIISLQRKAMFKFYLRLSLIIRYLIKRPIGFRDLLSGLYSLLARRF